MKNVILGQKLERDALISGSYVPRDGVEAARQAMGSGLIKVITGPRRAGKSVFAIQMLQGTEFAYVNFDDERLVALGDLDEVLKALVQVYRETKVLFFDEIQNVKNWELFVNRLHRRGFQVVLSGSNAHLLGRELATHLTGRFQEFRVFPFSFSEFLRAKGFHLDDTIALKERQGGLLALLDEYMTGGGYPEVVVRGVEAKSYLSTLFESILFKDVVKRYGVRHASKLADLGRYAISNHAREFSLTGLKNILGFRSVHTVEKYLGYLMEAFLAFTVDRFSYKAKERLKAPKKIYAFDPGVVQAIRFKTGADSGRLLESLVAIELLRRRSEFYYYKGPTGKDVDFAVKQGGEATQLLQVCYDPSDHQTRQREVRSLLKAGEELRCNERTVLSWDEEATETVSSKIIRFMPTWKWLLEQQFSHP